MLENLSGTAVGQPSLNPFWGSIKNSFSPIEQNQANETLIQAIALLQSLLSTSSQLAAHLGLVHPVTVAEVGVICRAAQRASEAPRLQGIQLPTNDWQSRRDAVRELLEAGRRMTEIQATNNTMLIAQAWEQTLLTERQNFVNYGDKWWRLLSGDFRQSRARLQGLCKSPLSKNNAECLTIIDSILEYQQHKRIYDQHAALGDALFGAQWNKFRSDWEVLSRLSEWIFTLYDDLGKGDLPVGIVDFLSGHSDASGLGETITPIRETVKALRLQLEALVKQLQCGENLPASSLLVMPLIELNDRLQLWLKGLPKLYQLVRFNQLHEEMVEVGLVDVAEKASHWEHKSEDLVHAFDLTWYSGLVEQGYAKSPSLQKFDHVKQAHQLDRFRRLDQSSLGHAQTELAKSIWDRMPSINQPGEMALIRNELNKKRRLMPIRQLIDQAGRAIQCIKCKNSSRCLQIS